MTCTHSETARLCRGLALLLHGGISLSEGLLLLAETETGGFRELLLHLSSSMEQGATLSDALERSGVFPDHVSGMVRMGEQSGRLEEALDRLARYCDQRQQTAVQIRQALAYPSLILLLMAAVIGVLLVVVLPVFDAVYASLGSHLTGLAAGLLHLGILLKAALPVLLVLLALLVIAVLVFSLSEPLRNAATARLRKHFGDRGVFRGFNNARFARAMTMGLGSGLPLEDALRLAAQLLSDIPGAVQRCEQCKAALENGGDLAKAMQTSDLLTPSQSRLLDLGLRSGSADPVMEELADRLMEDANEHLSRTISKIEPTMVLAASLLVGMILLSVMLPLVNILSTIG